MKIAWIMIEWLELRFFIVVLHDWFLRRWGGRRRRRLGRWRRLGRRRRRGWWWWWFLFYKPWSERWSTRCSCYDIAAIHGFTRVSYDLRLIIFDVILIVVVASSLRFLAGGRWPRGWLYLSLAFTSETGGSEGKIRRIVLENLFLDWRKKCIKIYLKEIFP